MMLIDDQVFTVLITSPTHLILLRPRPAKTRGSATHLFTPTKCTSSSSMESHPEPAVPPDDSQLSPDDNLSSCTSQTRSLYSSAGLKVKLNGFIRRCLVKYRSSDTNHQGYAHSLSLGSEFSRDVEDAARRQSLVVRLRRHVFDKGVFSKRFLPHLKFLKYHINPYGESNFYLNVVLALGGEGHS